MTDTASVVVPRKLWSVRSREASRRSRNAAGATDAQTQAAHDLFLAVGRHLDRVENHRPRARSAARCIVRVRDRIARCSQTIDPAS